MPQLMPLMWFSSIFMFLLIVMMMVDMYFYNFYVYNCEEMGINYDLMMFIKYKW